MAQEKSLRLWLVNVISFVLLIVLGSTGLLNWLVLPKGYEARGSFLVSLRHFLVEFHGWTALVFLVVIAVHIYLHGSFVKAQLRKTRNVK